MYCVFLPLRSYQLLFFWLCFSSSEDAMEYSKEFVTAVVLGKDLVPRQVKKPGASNFSKQFPCHVPKLSVSYLKAPCFPLFPIYQILMCFLLIPLFLVACVFHWTHTLMYHIPAYWHVPSLYYSCLYNWERSIFWFHSHVHCGVWYICAISLVVCAVIYAFVLSPRSPLLSYRTPVNCLLAISAVSSPTCALYLELWVLSPHTCLCIMWAVSSYTCVLCVELYILCHLASHLRGVFLLTCVCFI